MKSSAFLFQLIHSLSPAERRYFKRFALRHKSSGDNLYLELFSVLEKQESFDEAKAKAHFKGRSFGKSLAFPKSHLYELLLRSLQSFSHENSPNALYRSEMDKIELLLDRSFPDQALRILRKSLKRALQFEDCTPILQLLRWKRRIVLKLQDKDYVRTLEEISALEKHWEEAFRLEQEAIRLHDLHFATLQEVRRRNMQGDAIVLHAAKDRLSKLIAAPALNFNGKVTALAGMAHCCHLLGDFQGIHAAYKSAVLTWEALPHQIQAHSDRYIRTYGAYLNSMALIEEHANLPIEIERIRKTPLLKPAAEAQVFQMTYNLELFYLLNQGKHQEASARAGAISKGIEKYEKFMSPSVLLGFFYNLVLGFWLSGQAREALRWLLRILQFPEGNVRKDIREFAPLLEKVLHFEMGNMGQLESWFRSFNYRKKRISRTDRLEEVLLKLVKGLVRMPEKAAQEQVLSTFSEELDACAKLPGMSKLGLQELKDWANSQI